MRLYRGLKELYRREKVASTPGQPFVGTDFTNCPLTALRYAKGRRGVVLVLDAPTEMLNTLKFTEELWLGMGDAKRFIAWGKFQEQLDDAAHEARIGSDAPGSPVSRAAFLPDRR